MGLHESRRLSEGVAAVDRDEAPVSARFEFASFERTDGWLQAGEGEAATRQRLADFIAAIPCFTPQAALATESGPCLAGAIRPGQRVLTRDHGPQEVRWVGRRALGWRDLGLVPALRPVRIAAGALADGVPAADMLVSPNHRFLAALPGQTLTCATERLWQARHLIGRAGVERIDAPAVEYVQILLDRHELVLADGAWSESFQPSAARVAALAPEARHDLLTQLPALRESEPAFVEVRPEADATDS